MKGKHPPPVIYVNFYHRPWTGTLSLAPKPLLSARLTQPRRQQEAIPWANPRDPSGQESGIPQFTLPVAQLGTLAGWEALPSSERAAEQREATPGRAGSTPRPPRSKVRGPSGARAAVPEQWQSPRRRCRGGPAAAAAGSAGAEPAFPPCFLPAAAAVRTWGPAPAGGRRTRLRGKEGGAGSWGAARDAEGRAPVGRSAPEGTNLAPRGGAHLRGENTWEEGCTAEGSTAEEGGAYLRGEVRVTEGSSTRGEEHTCGEGWRWGEHIWGRSAPEGEDCIPEGRTPEGSTPEGNGCFPEGSTPEGSTPEGRVVPLRGAHLRGGLHPWGEHAWRKGCDAEGSTPEGKVVSLRDAHPQGSWARIPKAGNPEGEAPRCPELLRSSFSGTPRSSPPCSPTSRGRCYFLHVATLRSVFSRVLKEHGCPRAQPVFPRTSWDWITQGLAAK